MQYTPPAALIPMLLVATISATPLLGQQAQVPATRVPVTPINPVTQTVTPQPGSGLTVISNGSPEAGPYKLDLTSTSINGQSAAPTRVLSKNVSVTWNGATVAIAEPGGETLTGQVAGNHLSVSARAPDASFLSLSGTASMHHASGTFTLTEADGRNASGLFTLATPASHAMIKAVQQWDTPKPSPTVDPCNWWCQFKEWF